MKKRDTQLKYSFLPYKNLAVGLLFSVVLGPVGLLYATVRGGLIMILIGAVVLSNRFPVPIIMTWISCCIWSVIAINKYNNNIMEAWLENNNEEKNCSSIDS